MKILILSAANNIHTVRWVNALDERGHDVHLVYNSEHSPDIDKLSKNIKMYKLKYGGGYGYYLNAIQLKSIFKRIKPDVVNAHYASGYGTLARVARLKRVILSVWGSDIFIFPYKKKINMKIIKKNILYADKIASTSFCMAQKVKEIINNNIDITITPFGVDTNNFKKYNEVTQANKREFVFGTVKSLKPIYGIDDIIKAFYILKKRLHKEGIDEEIKLYIYGKGEQEKELKQLCLDLNIVNGVVFKGYIPNNEVPKAINNIDVFCLGSTSESFGVAAIEAMACEVPIIATDADGFIEVLNGERAGYIVPKKSPESMADNMYKLLMDRELRISMGRLGRKVVQDKYDWEKNVDIMENLYKETLN